MTIKHKFKHKFKLLGFTLIELLFVIAIVSVLVSLGVSMVQRHNQQAKVEKAALQMQQLMQAGLAYYVDNGCWPPSFGGSPSSSCKSTPPFANYIPVFERQTAGQQPLNPWGQNYNWGIPKYDDKSGTLQAQNNIFEVWTTTPDSNAATTNSWPIAKQISNILPNSGVGVQVGGHAAGCDTANNCVYTQTTIPAQGFSPPVYVAATGSLFWSVTSPRSLITSLAKCQPGYISSIQLSLRDRLYKSIPPPTVGRTSSYAQPVSLQLCAIRNKIGGSYNVCIDPSSRTRRVTSIAGLYVLAITTVFFYWEEVYHNVNVSMFDSYGIDYTIYCCSPNAGNLCPTEASYACSNPSTCSFT